MKTTRHAPRTDTRRIFWRAGTYRRRDLARQQLEVVLLSDSGDLWVIPYYHFSLVMNRERRLLVWAASNVDYSKSARKYTKTRKEYGGEDWRLDPRVALEAPGLQIEDADFYAPAKKIDRGAHRAPRGWRMGLECQGVAEFGQQWLLTTGETARRKARLSIRAASSLASGDSLRSISSVK